MNPIFARLDSERSGLIDWDNFKASIVKLFEVNAPDVGFQLINEQSYDEQKEELLYLLFVNALLADYEPNCALFEVLGAKLPLPTLLKRETDLCQKLETESAEKVVSPFLECFIQRGIIQSERLLVDHQCRCQLEQ